jgi:hypothetical protein
MIKTIMKITKQELRKVIREEISKLNENKFRPEIVKLGDDTYSHSPVTFNTEAEAKKWLDTLAVKSKTFDLSRIVPNNHPKTQKVNLKKDNFYQNFRKDPTKQS